jgi:hypothetical protein
VHLPISREGRRIVRNHALGATGLAVFGLGLVFVGFAAGDAYAWAGVLGIFVVLGALIYGNIKAAALRAAKLKSGEVWLAGASSEFLASLPPYQR